LTDHVHLLKGLDRAGRAGTAPTATLSVIDQAALQSPADGGVLGKPVLEPESASHQPGWAGCIDQLAQPFGCT
jgi:hypothetical protein